MPKNTDAKLLTSFLHITFQLKFKTIIALAFYSLKPDRTYFYVSFIPMKIRKANVKLPITATRSVNTVVLHLLSRTVYDAWRSA